MTIKYVDGLKHQLVEMYVCSTPVIGEQFEHEYFSLYPSGVLVIRKGGQLDRDSLWRGRLWLWWQHRDETGLCEAGRFVYILLIDVDISERCPTSVYKSEGW